MNEIDATTIKSPRVSISKGKSPMDNFKEGIKNLGGIIEFIKKDENVFLKINLIGPEGYPVNFNFDLLKTVVQTCKKAGNKLIIGAFPYMNIPSTHLFKILGLTKFFNDSYVELVNLDMSDLLYNKTLNEKEISRLKSENFERMQVENRNYLYPKLILNADKLVIFNQFNVNPLFNFTVSLFNLFHVIPSTSRKIDSNPEDFEEFVQKPNKVVGIDYYNHLIAQKVIDLYTIKKPDLVINDLFYVLETAGPLIYADSNLRKTTVTVVGNEALSTDIVTLRLLDQNIYENEIILNARERKIGPKDLSEIEILGVSLDENKIHLNSCPTNLEELDIINTDIRNGETCQGCYNRLYQFLQYLKTYAIKDLKYLRDWSILSGLNPEEPRNLKDIVVFGNCAVKTTTEYEFRKITKKTLIKKEDKEVKNKDVLEIPGCPPDMRRIFKSITDYFGKQTMPSLNFLMKFDKLLKTKKSYQKNIKKFEKI